MIQANFGYEHAQYSTYGLCNIIIYLHAIEVVNRIEHSQETRSKGHSHERNLLVKKKHKNPVHEKDGAKN